MLKAILGLKQVQKSLSLISKNCYSIKASQLFNENLQRFKYEKISEPENSLELIFADVLKKKKLREVRGENLEKIELSEDEVKAIEENCLARLSHMPTQYILKEWEFRDLLLKMRIPVFIPRPETEELVELIAQQLRAHENYKILEVGCGSGAISLALLNESRGIKQIIAIDQSQAACNLTLENAKNLNLSDRLKVFKHKLESGQLPDEITSITDKFDIIISNPPYVPTKDIFKLDPEIYLYEDIRAIDGGSEGLDIIKNLLELAANHLKKGGNLWIEVDHRHAEIIAKLVENNCEEWNLKFVASYKDIFKKERFVEIEKN